MNNMEEIFSDLAYRHLPASKDKYALICEFKKMYEAGRASVLTEAELLEKKLMPTDYLPEYTPKTEMVRLLTELRDACKRPSWEIDVEPIEHVMGFLQEDIDKRKDVQVCSVRGVLYSIYTRAVKR